MDIRFIYGSSGSGKTTYIIDEIEKIYKTTEDNGKILLVIVPEQLTFQTEKKLINRFGFLGSRIEVTSFKRLAYRLFKEVGGVTKTYMDSAGKTMMLHKIIGDIQTQLKVFSGCINQVGFVNNILDIICEFKRYNISAEMLDMLKNQLPEDSFIYDKLSDLSLVYNRFNQSINLKYADAEEDLNVAARKLIQSEIYKDIDVWLDEFSGFTPQQYLLLLALCQNGCNLNFTLNMNFHCEEDAACRDVFSPIIYTRDKIIEMAVEHNIRLLEPVKLQGNPPNKFINALDIAYLEQNYFKYPFIPYGESTNSIEIFKAKNVYSEVEDTARSIVSLCRDKGASVSEIAVIMRNLDDYEALIKSVFQEYDIPYFLDKKKDISSNMFMVLLTSLMDILENNWNYESVFRYLKTYLTDVGEDEIQILENYVLEAGIKGKKAWTDDHAWYTRLIMIYKFKDKLSREIKKYFEEKGMVYRDEELAQYIIDMIIDEKNEMLQTIEDEKKLYDIALARRITKARDLLIAPIVNLGTGFRGSKSVKEFCTTLFSYMESMNMGEKLEKIIQEFNENDQYALAEEYSKVWNFFVELMEQMVEVIGDEKVNLEEFSNTLSMGLKDHKMGFIPQTIEEVMVSSIERFKGHNIKYLFILGVNDGVFPKSMDKEGLLTDRDRLFLREKGIELAKDTRSVAFEEQYLIYTTLTLGSDFIRISYPIADKGEKALRPSMIILRLKALFPLIKERSDVITYENERLISAPIPAFNALITSFQDICNSGEVPPIFGETCRWFMGQQQWKNKLMDIMNHFSYCNEAKNIGCENALKLYGEDMKLSVSRIENYVRCPFAYFIKYGLNAEERKVFSLTPPDLGTFIHGVLDRFARLVEEESSFKEIDEAKREELINRSFNEEMERSSGSMFKATKRFNYFGNRIGRILRVAAKFMVMHMQQGEFLPLGYEIEFGFKEGTYSPIEIKISNDRVVKLVGKIDRVDKLVESSDNYYRVIDYKSGNKDFKLWEVYYGLQIQLLTYLDAILEREQHNTENLTIPAGILYFKVDNPMIKTDGDVDPAEIELDVKKQLKMKGIVLDEEDIIRKMDKDLQGNSLIIPVGFKKDGSLSSMSKVASREQFQGLKNHNKKVILENCEEIYDGNIGISPVKTKVGNACDYCQYASICVFDSNDKDNEYRCFYEMSDDEVWQLIREECKENE
ncbi:DNA helicase/exodeoxyribonuclease V, subunit B [Hathewaya proteolytica DSM 3090]|uniref:DNA helicase/exodeoxyribonuclease V, subunit B n=1 Tax=Hathewaya proteolytica DSM 3090 TaxID=1121331 RepID=A0A1M6NDE5_9CLOT|nr:PD-(D/E)XK nuclease family protein [Hathewaya proteolytica]SHJ93772.1 DNA helicase/exodeoxyribonuclease V, subunit B [Hathewaya proteolytica DSM 3090]